MDTRTFPLRPERLAELADYAKRHAQDEATALDTALAEFFAWEKQEYDETVKAVIEANEQVKAGRTRPAEEFLEEVRVKYGFPL